jgi:hypothetical protein
MVIHSALGDLNWYFQAKPLIDSRLSAIVSITREKRPRIRSSSSALVARLHNLCRLVRTNLPSIGLLVILRSSRKP